MDDLLAEPTYTSLITAAQAKLREALAAAESGGYRASMPLILNSLGVRDQGVEWLVDGTVWEMGLAPWPPLAQETAKHVLWTILDPEITEDNLEGWWEEQIRGLIHRADVALAHLAGEDFD